MSQNVRQNNLFAAEDFTKIYKSFQDVDFKAYDIESIQTALIDNLRLNYPETFNDYIQSSEFIAHIRLLSYIASSLAFRTDLNARENILDTAERRESVIRLAKMVNYYPSRNIPLSGILKLVAIQTNEPIVDSVGRVLQNQTIFWDDPNNKDSYDHFITVMNSALSNSNPFGKPYKKKTINGIPTSIYQLNNLKDYEVAYPFSSIIDGKSMSFDVCNVDMDDDGVFSEMHPNPQDAFNLIYRVDGQGLSSVNTGFFLYFKQGNLIKKDYLFEVPLLNRVTEIDVENVNETDVYVQEINQEGDVLTEWVKIDNVNGGSNLIYNAINLNQRNIYSVTSGLNDTIKLNFTDGNFGNIPTGIFRVWMRASANRNATLQPEQIQQKQITIPYLNAEGKRYSLTLTFSLQYSISNGATTETTEQVKNRAPQAYYTQNRMVNNEDYNVYPLVRGNEILKVRTVNRTHAGHSRYADINDPTGFHQNLTVYSDDGAIYSDDTIPSSVIYIDNTIEENTENALINTQYFVRNRDLNNFFYDVVLKQYKSYKEQVYDTLPSEEQTYNKYNVFEFYSDSQTYFPLFFNTKPESNYDNIGVFKFEDGEEYDHFDGTVHIKGRTFFLTIGSKVKLVSTSDTNDFEYVTIKNIYTDQDDSCVFVFDKTIKNGWEVKEILPKFDTTFSEDESDIISSNMKVKNNFSLLYDLDNYNSPWVVKNTYNESGVYSYGVNGKDWLLVAKYKQNLTNNKSGYELISRGLTYIFESYKDVRFFFDEEQYDYDSYTGKSKRDTIEISTHNNIPSFVERWELKDLGWAKIGDSLSAIYPKSCLPLISRDISDNDVVVTVLNDTDDDSTLQYGLNNGLILFQGESVGDIIEITYNNINKNISRPLIWDVCGNVYQEDGYQDQSKAIIVPTDTDNDGVPDVPFIFDQISSYDDLVFLEEKPDLDGYVSKRLWKSTWYNYINKQSTDISITYEDLIKTVLFLVDDVNSVYLKNVIMEVILYHILQSDAINSVDLNLSVSNTVIYTRKLESGYVITKNDDIHTILETISIDNDTLNRLLQFNAIFKESNNGLPMSVDSIKDDVILNPITFVQDINHHVKIGRSTSLDLMNQDSKFYYKWMHYPPIDNRVDPSISNIMDMILLTSSYYREVLIWKNKKGTIDTLPKQPTSEELRLQFSDFNNFKMQSDQIIFQPAKFKLLFGKDANSKLQAKFKVVKTNNASVSDNEIKTLVIEAIDIFFNVGNWDFGESFYYTELAAFIHRYLAKYLASVVIVPVDKEGKFGDLFQIKSESNELFLSTATVDNVEVVSSLTENNMRA